MELNDPASTPTFSFPIVLDFHKFYELMVAQGKGRSPMTFSDAETNSEASIIIIIIGAGVRVLRTRLTDPYVHLLGESAACIAYKRTTDLLDRSEPSPSLLDRSGALARQVRALARQVRALSIIARQVRSPLHHC